MPRIPFLAMALFFSSTLGGAPAAPLALSLAGPWRLALDRQDVGLTEGWFGRTWDEQVMLPGSLPGQGKGDPVTLQTPWTGTLFDKSYYTAERFAEYRQPGHIKVPFWLQPETYYAGVAWYQRDFELPREWIGQRVVLVLERPHWTTRAWLDDREIGTDDSLSTPHVHDLGVGLAPGHHRLTVRVDNGRVVDIGENSHSISDQTQGNWNGMVGTIELRAMPTVWVEELQVYPQVRTKSVRVRGRVGTTAGAGQPTEVELIVRLERTAPTAPAATRRCVVAADGTFEGELALGTEAPEWDEFHPALHRLTATLPNGANRTTTFGLREIGADGAQLTLNGRKIFIRATLECAIFPETGHPPLDVASWKRVLDVARSFGLNSLRFHSWCPPEAAFVAGDELGFYFQVEAASWPNQSTTLGDAKPVDDWLERETGRILREYGNHPSFVFMSSSNEPGGDAANAYLAKWVNRHRAADSRRLFTAGSGWPQLPENQYHVTPDPRIQHWDEGLKSRINAQPPETVTDYRAYIAAHSVPVISHEIGQWCVFPDFAEMPAYTGYLKPRNFEIFQTWLQRHGLGDRAREFLSASGKLQVLCYKEDIESALRTPGMGGFQLLDLHDFPGQGTALVGVLNAFWRTKGYVSAEEYHRFCGPTVPLARLAKRVFSTQETLEADCEVAHFGPAPLSGATASWRLVADDGRVAADGTFPARDIPVGNGTSLGRIAVPLAPLAAPARYKLVVQLAAGIENDWDVWVYPEALEVSVPERVHYTHELDDAAVAALQSGSTVLLAIPPARVRNDGPDPIVLGFSSIFWNTSWTNRQPPTTLGILCDPRHPALARFPTDAHSNWQWWYLVTRAAPLRLDGLPASLQPIVSVIDDWFTSRRLALVAEARVGGGRLLVTSIELDVPGQLVNRQLKASLLQYAASPEWRPKAELSLEQVRAWFGAAHASLPAK